MPVQDYSTDPNLNITVGGIFIGENCAPGNINNAIRIMMADIRVFYNSVPVAGTFVTKENGVFTNNPTHNGRGGYHHNNNASDTGGRWFVQQQGGAVPSGMVNGDWLAEYI